MIGSLAYLTWPWLKLESCWATKSILSRRCAGSNQGLSWLSSGHWLCPELHLRKAAALFTYLTTKPAPPHQGPKPIQPSDSFSIMV